ncbi:MAG: sulfonate ABC transporter substrate-binding protein [Zoogloea sp.]|nr:sulfonate ABC transporter substrate-binding protein [Zoogloea sp.]
MPQPEERTITMRTFHRARRRTLAILIGLGLVGANLPAHAADKPAAREQLRIGYQKYGTLIILKARGTLERRLAASGVEVKWVEFPAGPQLLEGLNVGSIDIGTVGEAPPIFAQAAGADLVYVANEPPAPKGEAILVRKDSPIRSVKELKGRRVAFNKGSNVHFLLVKALEKAGLQYKDIEPVYLPPADARAAFERGSVDAWVIWDPFLAAAEKQLGARPIADGTGIVSNHQFYVASRPYAEHHPEVVTAIVEELARIDDWGKKNIGEVATFLSSQIGLDFATVELAAARSSYGVRPIDAKVVAEQQKIADAFHDLKLIPKKLAIRDVVLPARR